MEGERRWSVASGQWLVKAVFSGETVASEGNGEWEGWKEDWKGGRREEKQWKWREREGEEEGVIV